MHIQSYIKELYGLIPVYEKTIKLQKPIKFGVEIEFADASKEEVYKFINDNINEITIYKAIDYLIWNVKNEYSVQKTVNGKIYGGEIVSPILKNDETSWESYKKVSECFRIYNFNFTEKCGFHVHFDSNIFNNKNFKKNLFKIWMLFEDIIYRTGYGRTAYERKQILDYAEPTNFYIYNNLNQFENEDSFNKFVKWYSKENHYGLNFSNIILYEIISSKKNTYEIRCANALETLFLMQNTIRFYARLLLYCDCNNFDSEYIDYLIKSFKPMYLEQFREEKFEKAMTLANLIYDDELDKMYFMKQYLKCLEDEETQFVKKKLI